MSIGKKKAREMLSLIKEARRAATMERMSVGWPGETVSVSGTFAGDNDGVTTPTNTFAKKLSRIVKVGLSARLTKSLQNWKRRRNETPAFLRLLPEVASRVLAGFAHAEPIDPQPRPLGVRA